jgi:hypothetical protein
MPRDRGIIMPNYPKITAKELFEVIQKLDFYYSHTTSSR